MVLAEAPRAGPQESKGYDLIPPGSHIRTVPESLTRRFLKRRIEEEGSISEDLWTQRGRVVEEYVEDIIASQTTIVKKVDLNIGWTTEGPDMTVNLVDGTTLRVEVTSSSRELKHHKQAIREKIFTEEDNGQLIGPWTRDLASSEWNKMPDATKELTISGYLMRNGIILINGGEKDRREKTPDEILKDSFYPQLRRILNWRQLPQA